MKKETDESADDEKTSQYNYEESSLGRHFDKFKSKSSTLREQGIYLILATIGNLGLLLFSAVSAGFFLGILLSISAFLCLWCILGAFIFELQRKDGNILFEVISNELHTSKIQGDEYGESTISDSQGIDRVEAIVELRKFAHHSELPLVPGRYGPAILLLINLGVFAIIYITT